ncbi:GFA family protein [uncultured Tateyamaria sp.]|uniref:GFA family protein n=1 Tax=uncultured Tateyamaria sp. TaxID=455651 RepID=UPI00261021F8|nr:GFA family protein [uncultured Tateyamaria sp.]
MSQNDASSRPNIKGGCLCGAVTYRVTSTFEKLFLCSCDQCRHITGSAFASNLFVDVQGFEWHGGSENIMRYQVPGRDISKSFCRVCGAGVPWISGNGTKMIVPAGSLSEQIEVAERIRIFASEQPDWAADLTRVPAHATFPKPSGI